MSNVVNLDSKTDEKLKEIFTKEIISELKNNKSLITLELLTELRTYGNLGKKIALDILETPQDEEMFFVDSFQNKISFNGNRQIKKSFTQMDISPIHEEEIQRCIEDIHYFKDNYIQIRTKTGVNFPDLRQYQNDFIDTVSPDENEDIIGLMGRQCCSAETVVNIDGKEISMEELFNECKKAK